VNDNQERKKNQGSLQSSGFFSSVQTPVRIAPPRIIIMKTTMTMTMTMIVMTSCSTGFQKKRLNSDLTGTEVQSVQSVQSSQGSQGVQASQASKISQTSRSWPFQDVSEVVRSNSPNRLLKVGEVIESIAFGSCMDQNYPQKVWETLNSESLDLFIGLGDFVYASHPQDKPIGKAYLKQLEQEKLKEFRLKVPWIGVWDDHDFGVNDGGGDHEEFEEAKTHLLAFLPNSSRVIPPEQKGLYHSIILGNKPKKLQIILLDTRTYRSPLVPHAEPSNLQRYQANLDESSTLLGSDQWDWLEKEFQKPANFRILVSSIQVLPEKHGFEKWANFPHERKKLLDLIEKNKLQNLVILSGDRHFSELSSLKLNKKHHLLEITGSGLNKKSQLEDEINPLRIGRPYFQANYGVLKIDYMKRRAWYYLKSEDGHIQYERPIRF
jgi:alkaline phosphatase D